MNCSILYLFLSVLVLCSTGSIRILEQNVGVAPSPTFGCQSFYEGSMCWVTQEEAFASNAISKGPFDLVFLAEVMDERDCENSTKTNGENIQTLTCQKYPQEQQISRLLSDDFTKICDGHRSCVGIHKNFSNVPSCTVSSTCMDALLYQPMKICKNHQVKVSGISYIDLQPYEMKGEILRVILYHPIGYQDCSCADCYMEYVQIMERLFEGAENILIAGDFNFDVPRLSGVAGMPVFEGYYQNVTESNGIKFFNSYYETNPEMNVATELGQVTLDWVGSNYYSSGTCENLNAMEERMDYPVLTFDHRGQICELSTNNSTTGGKSRSLSSRRRKRTPSISKYDVIDSLVWYGSIYAKDLFDSTPIHVLGTDFWFNVSDCWVAQPYGLPILTQKAVSTTSLVVSTGSEFIFYINGTVRLNVYNKIVKKRWDEGTVIAKLVLKDKSDFQICATFCDDNFEPVCFKNNPKYPSAFCPANSTCPEKYQKMNGYMQVTNLQFEFDEDKSSIEVENVDIKLIQDIVDFLLKEGKGLLFKMIEDVATSYLKGRVFDVNV